MGAPIHKRLRRRVRIQSKEPQRQIDLEREDNRTDDEEDLVSSQPSLLDDSYNDHRRVSLPKFMSQDKIT